MLHERADFADVVPGVCVHSVPLDAGEALVVGADGLVAVVRIVVQVLDEQDPGGDVVVRVERIQLTADRVAHPFSGGWQNLHGADSVSRGHSAGIKAGFDLCMCQGQSWVHAIADCRVGDDLPHLSAGRNLARKQCALGCVGVGVRLRIVGVVQELIGDQRVVCRPLGGLRRGPRGGLWGGRGAAELDLLARVDDCGGAHVVGAEDGGEAHAVLGSDG